MYGQNGGVPGVAEVLKELSAEKPIFGYVADYLDKYAFFEVAGAKTVGVLRVIAQYVSAACSLQMSSGEALANIQREVAELLGE